MNRSLTCFICVLLSIVALLLIFSSDETYAQDVETVRGTEGTSFWMAFPLNFRDWNEDPTTRTFKPAEPLLMTLAISSSVLTTGYVEAPLLGIRHQFTVIPGRTAFVTIDTSLQLDPIEKILPKGVHIVSDEPITVIATSHRHQTTDSYLILPESTLGKEYRLVGYRWLAKDLISQGAIVATENQTTIEITPTARTLSGKANDLPFSIMLNEGEVFNMRAFFDVSKSSDLTGTHITSSKPVAVFSGHNCAYVPDVAYKACNILVEQVPPVETWGTEFVIGRLASRSGYSVRVLASEDSTVVVEGGDLVATLDAGEFVERTISDRSIHLNTSKPVLVAQYSHGYTSPDPITAHADSIGDPMMMFIPPISNYGYAYRFTAPFDGTWKNYATITARLGEHEEIAIGREKISPNVFRRIPGSDFVVAHILVSSGTHTVVSEHPIGMVCYGFGYDEFKFDAYGNGTAMLAKGAEKELPEELTEELEDAVEIRSADGATFKGKVWESIEMPELESRE